MEALSTRNRTLRRLPGLVVGLLAWASTLEAQRYPFQLFSQAEGLDSVAIRSLLQDREGFLWIGTANGLFRYDGSRFLAYRPPLGPRGSRVSALYQSGDGTLWAGTETGLHVARGAAFEPVGGDLPFRFSHSIAEDRRGRMWFGTTRGLWFADPPFRDRVTLQRQPLPRAMEAEPVYAVHSDPQGVVWFGCGSGLCRLADGVVARVEHPETAGEAPWSAIRTDAEGTLWVRSRRRLVYRSRGSEEYVRVEGVPGWRQAGGLGLDPEGRIAVPTEMGLYLLTAGRWRKVSEAEGLPDDPVCCVLWDHEKTPWIGMEAHGLARWRGYGDWESWTKTEGLSSNAVSAIARDAAGTLWVGTGNGLNRMDARTRQWRVWTTREGLPDNAVRALVASPDGAVWVASSDQGLARVDAARGTVRTIGEAEGLRSRRIVSLSVDGDQRLWVTTRDGVFRANLRSSPLRFERWEIPSPEGRETWYRTLIDRRGTVWMAGTRGLARLEAGRWTRFGERDGLLSRNLVFLAADRVGTLWVGYNGTLGVTRVKPEGGKLRTVHFSQNDALRSSEISFVESDGRGWIWVGTESGVDVWDGEVWRHYGPEDGLIWQDTVYGAFLADADGSIWIGTQRGLSHLLHPERQAYPEPPPVAVTAARFGDRAAVTQEGYRSRARAAAFDFAGLSFLATERVIYRYRLLGQSEEWTETRQRTASFTNLAPGRYQFEVIARSAAGAWSPTPARVSFEVLPAWWQTWWFRLAALALLTAVASAAWHWRVRRLLEEQRRLEIAVRERTAEIAREKATVERQKQEIERLLVETREANRLKGEFLANMSHEIRTPLNGVLGMTTLALETHPSPEQRDYLETIETAGRSLLSLLNDILDFSKIEAGRLDLETSPFHLSVFLEETVRTIAYPARAKGLAVTVEVAPELPEVVMGDPVRLRQVLVNLLSNAVKFTAEGSIGVAVAADGGLAHFTVSDTGIGIPSDKQAIIFDPFRQADGSTTRKYGGTGLGLAICARLVELMGGRIWVESAPEKGSRFHFTARLGGMASGQAPGVPPPATAEAPRPLRILLAEDHALSQKVVEVLLRKRGHSVTTAANGREALALATEQPFDLVLMDMEMPELDGLAATRLIREHERGKGGRLPIFMITANTTKEDRERCLEAGADGYLAKPVLPEELFRTIEQAAGGVQTA